MPLHQVLVKKLVKNAKNFGFSAVKASNTAVPADA
jgi:hypothetical protein